MPTSDAQKAMPPLTTDEMMAVCEAFAIGTADEARKEPYRPYEDKVLGEAYTYGRAKFAEVMAMKAKQGQKGPRK